MTPAPSPTAAERDATAQTPLAAGRWAVLAALCQAAGQPGEALRAQQTAQALQQTQLTKASPAN